MEKFICDETLPFQEVAPPAMVEVDSHAARVSFLQSQHNLITHRISELIDELRSDEAVDEMEVFQIRFMESEIYGTMSGMKLQLALEFRCPSCGRQPGVEYLTEKGYSGKLDAYFGNEESQPPLAMTLEVAYALTISHGRLPSEYLLKFETTCARLDQSEILKSIHKTAEEWGDGGVYDQDREEGE